MGRIQQLSTSVINKIAAGEVIERPANVVKELLENSLDALSTRIDVEILQGGAELIRIVDDGEGIHPDDILLAVASHATSKIHDADDLFHVQTMGFRGEALASVAEVSHLRIRSRQHDLTEGTELEVILGEVKPATVCGCPRGTQIEIRQLFANTPVRRKFLKTKGTEFGHITEQFTRIALANPRLHLTLKHDGKSVYDLPATERMLDRLRLFFGGEVAEQLIWVESEHAGIRMWGYVGHPAVSKSTRKAQYLYLNGRWIQDRTLQAALTEAYRGLLMVGRHPVAFLFIDLPASEVDVNVHPTKVEVRFQDSQQLFRQLLAMLRTKFLSLNLESVFHLPCKSAGAGDAGPLGSANDDVHPTLPGLGRSTAWNFGPAGTNLAPVKTVDPIHQRALQDQFAAWAQHQLQNAVQRHTSGEDEPIESEAGELESGSDVAAVAVLEQPHPGADFHSPIQPEAVGIPAAEWSMAPHPATAMQVHDCYLVVETDEGLTIIDQHALHERILYELLRNRVLAGAVESQRMLLPLPVEVTAREAQLLAEHAETLRKVGCDISDFGQGTVLLNAYPAMLRRIEPTRLVRDLAEQLDSRGHSVSRRDILDELLHMMSCKAAIKAGQRLSAEEIDSLLAQRHLVDDAHHCPHGRPTALKLSRMELDRQFGRLG